ncbi:uncharacterized protein BDW43DRAFT_268341 [Aspergillus alliaceus]|uniref:uncharacterized protein n=1 Tax=Petromyces alliaceus TaxID=209559 RepID=UPI0012A44545|nr:uncharacterized protein BDW43DRAFT_268341 [Aspergillus alliaceus]KAB8236368.1 hypothetical protein BDW43DRAFT_268341 [Aspergillus alliaceus]
MVMDCELVPSVIVVESVAQNESGEKAKLFKSHRNSSAVCNSLLWPWFLVLILKSALREYPNPRDRHMIGQFYIYSWMASTTQNGNVFY